ncbi:MAG: hypothetical protein Q8M16_02365 [Pirellulaceae bacterium]|nr:hypothetical protein [Pirellulaceae bacterium]
MGTSNDKESVLDVLSRMKTELKFDVANYNDTDTPSSSSHGDSLKKSSPASLMTAANEPKATTPGQETSATETVEELTNYMGTLLSRYGKGDPASEAAPASPAAETASIVENHLPQRKPRPPVGDRPATTDATVPATITHVDSSGEAIPEELICLDFIPRKRPPEEKACMDAMRELAVHSARKAIQACDNKKRGFDAKHRLMLGFGALGVSAIAFLVAESPFSLLGTVAMCGIATSCMFFVNWQRTIALLKKADAT